MTDEELDEARAKEALSIVAGTREAGDNAGYMRQLALTAARLARENWRPEDPLLKEAREIIVSLDVAGDGSEADIRGGRYDDFPTVRIALAALRRGIELARGQGS